MGILSDALDAINSFLTIRFSGSDVKVRYMIEKKQHDLEVREQWNRLFSIQNMKSLNFLKRFKEENEWIKPEEKYSNYEFDYGYNIQDKKIEKNNQEYNLFQLREDGYVRINLFLYKDFQKEIHKYEKRFL